MKYSSRELSYSDFERIAEETKRKHAENRQNMIFPFTFGSIFSLITLVVLAINTLIVPVPPISPFIIALSIIIAIFSTSILTVSLIKAKNKFK